MDARNVPLGDVTSVSICNSVYSAQRHYCFNILQHCAYWCLYANSESSFQAAWMSRLARAPSDCICYETLCSHGAAQFPYMYARQSIKGQWINLVVFLPIYESRQLIYFPVSFSVPIGMGSTLKERTKGERQKVLTDLSPLQAYQFHYTPQLTWEFA